MSVRINDGITSCAPRNSFSHRGCAAEERTLDAQQKGAAEAERICHGIGLLRGIAKRLKIVSDVYSPRGVPSGISWYGELFAARKVLIRPSSIHE